MTTAPGGRELREAVLSVIATSEVSIRPHDHGLELADGSLLGWSQVAAVCGARALMSMAGRARIGALLRVHDHLARQEDVRGMLLEQIQLRALPRGHVHHLGPAWSLGTLAGGALSLGLALAVPGWATPAPVPRSALTARRVTITELWPAASARLEERSAIAAQLLSRDGRHAGTLRPVGDTDVLTLLAGAPLRRALARGDGTGMRAVAVPDRTRGWFDLARVDPAYVALAWQLTDETERGVRVPLLVTTDEVAAASIRGDLTRQAIEPR